jgi:PhoPQ-activated pathogenicity-related protein
MRGMGKRRWWASGAVAWVLLCGALAAARAPLTGPLADYVNAPDPSYGWYQRSEGSVLTCRYIELILTSQTWRGIVWKHQLFVIRPPQVDAGSKHAMLMIAGGNWKDELADPKTPLNLPREAQLLALVAQQLRTPVAILLHVPQQPILGGRREDQIISYTFRQFLDSGDPTWPLLAPMVKSAVRAMDAVQEAARQRWDLPVETFTVTGASKRGWTTWLTAAVDDRAVAIAPMVIDMLNMSSHIKLQKASFNGQTSEQIDDYKGLDEEIDTPRGQLLRQIVDPWEYRQRLTQPKLVILGTNDRYWPLDACDLYWNDLEGEKYLLYVPNSGHGLEDRARVVAGLCALHRRVLSGQKLPQPVWTFENGADHVQLQIASDVKPSRVRIWRAQAPTRDFREARWSDLPAQVHGERYVHREPIPASGFAAMLGELVFGEGTAAEFSLSTSVRIVASEAAGQGP